MASDWIRRFGLDVARDLMGYRPDSTTLVKYYLRRTSTLDIITSAME